MNVIVSVGFRCVFYSKINVISVMFIVNGSVNIICFNVLLWYVMLF